MREWGPLLHVERKPGVTFTHIHDFLSRVLIGLDMAALAGTAANKTNFQKAFFAGFELFIFGVGHVDGVSQGLWQSRVSVFFGYITVHARTRSAAMPLRTKPEVRDPSTLPSSSMTHWSWPCSFRKPLTTVPILLPTCSVLIGVPQRALESTRF